MPVGICEDLISELRFLMLAILTCSDFNFQANEVLH